MIDYLVHGTIYRITQSFDSVALRVGIDVNQMYYAYFDNIDGIKNKKYLFDITGRGETIYDAYMDLLYQLINPNIRIRYLKKYYATTKIRKIIKESNLF